MNNVGQDSFSQIIDKLSQRSKQAERIAKTEEATKTAVIMPFLNALGFDSFNLNEVIPEFIADVGMKKGEKVDYAIKKDGEIIMIIEAKAIGTKLNRHQSNQLHRYFAATKTRVAILTNGRNIEFYSDTEAVNIMDKQPFFSFDLQSYDQYQVSELARFHKKSFTVAGILEAAVDLQYARNATAYLKKQFEDPGDDFITLIGRRIHTGQLTKTLKTRLYELIKQSIEKIILNRIESKLGIVLVQEKNAYNNAPPALAPPVLTPASPAAADNNGIITTNEELQAFMMVQAIGAKVCPVDRIHIRDAKSYCAIFMDNNNRRPICRLYFTATNMKIGIFSSDKTEVKYDLSSVNDIYRHSAALLKAINLYL